MIVKKKKTRKLPKKRGETVLIVKEAIDPKDTLFPEKVAKAKERLSNADFNGLI